MAYGEKREGSTRRRFERILAVVLGALVVTGGAASAQVPPDVPDIPPEVDQALTDVAVVLIPALHEVVVAAEPAANGAGVAIRPACASVGIAFYAGALTGVVIPYPSSMNYYLSPVSLVCLAATTPGPADPAFEEADAAAGPTISEQADPVVGQVADTLVPQLGPVHPELGELCTNYTLTDPIVQQLPPTLQRVRPIAIVCSRV